MKSIVETCVYSIHKVKNVFGTIIQITCFSIWKNIIVCLVCVCSILKKLTITVPFNIFLFDERETRVYYHCTPFLLSFLFSPDPSLFALFSCKTKSTVRREMSKTFQPLMSCIQFRKHPSINLICFKLINLPYIPNFSKNTILKHST